MKGKGESNEVSLISKATQETQMVQNYQDVAFLEMQNKQTINQRTFG